MCNYCCDVESKCGIYMTLIGNIIINIYFLAILILSSYNISLLNYYQKVFLILSIINWIFLPIFYIYKFFLIILGKFTENNSLKTVWKIINIPGFIIIGISLIYDLFIVPTTSGFSGFVIYYIFFAIMCSIFVILSIYDYSGIEKQIEISQNKFEKLSANKEQKQE